MEHLLLLHYRNPLDDASTTIHACKHTYIHNGVAYSDASAAGLQQLTVVCSQHLTLQGVQHLSRLRGLRKLLVGSCGTLFKKPDSSRELEYRPIKLSSEVN
jgi:hypothetical protein